MWQMLLRVAIFRCILGLFVMLETNPRLRALWAQALGVASGVCWEVDVGSPHCQPGCWEQTHSADLQQGQGNFQAETESNEPSSPRAALGSGVRAVNSSPEHLLRPSECQS